MKLAFRLLANGAFGWRVGTVYTETHDVALTVSLLVLGGCVYLGGMFAREAME